jgi:trehalose/maltose hydrolase-like predicted phosphorylase
MTSWLLRYEGYDEQAEPLREALCALGNGRFATRGAAPESRADGVHYPGTYAAGVFNRLAVEIDGHSVENESIVNLPDWQSLAFRAEGGDWCLPSTTTISDYVQELDLRRGVLTRRFCYTDAQGRRTAVAQRRLVSMADPYLAGLDATLVAENWSGRLEVRSGLDARVGNTGVARYVGLGGQHLDVLAAGRVGADAVALDVETTQSHVRVSLAARHRVVLDGAAPVPAWRLALDDRYVGQDVGIDLAEGASCTVEKVIALYTSHDRGISEPGEEARQDRLCAGLRVAPVPSRPGLGLPLGTLRPGDRRATARFPGPAPAPVPPPPDCVGALRGPRCRHSGPRPARGGVPRAHLLG